MKNVIAVGLATILGASATALGGTAQIQLFNNSVEMSPGPCSCGFGMVWKLHFCSYFTEDPAQANGELLRRANGSATTHWGYMLLEDPSMYASTTVAELDVPTLDLSGNGIPDFFEAGRQIAAATSGTYPSSIGGGTLTASWSREADSAVGTCTLWMNDRVLGTMGPFVHTFQILNYTGTFSYQRTQTSATGTVALSQAGFGGWQGTMQLVRLETDPVNTLVLQAGFWSNASDTFVFEETTLTRDPGRPGTYFGSLSNPSGDFRSWTVLVVDPNDSNGNGIPDLSDSLPVQPPQTPKLALQQNGAKLALVIKGEVGRTHEVQASTTLVNPAWQPVTNVVLTSDGQAIDLPIPAGGATFWRVIAR